MTALNGLVHDTSSRLRQFQTHGNLSCLRNPEQKLVGLCPSGVGLAGTFSLFLSALQKQECGHHQ